MKRRGSLVEAWTQDDCEIEIRRITPNLVHGWAQVGGLWIMVTMGGLDGVRRVLKGRRQIFRFDREAALAAETRITSDGKIQLCFDGEWYEILQHTPEKPHSQSGRNHPPSESP